MDGNQNVAWSPNLHTLLDMQNMNCTGCDGMFLLKASHLKVASSNDCSGICIDIACALCSLFPGQVLNYGNITWSIE